MKKLLLSAAALLIALGSCQNDLEEVSLSKAQHVVVATIENQTTRLGVNYNNETNVFQLNWSANDAFKVFGDNNSNAVYEWIENNNNNNEFTLADGNTAPTNPTYAVYPYSQTNDPAISDNTVTMTLSATPSISNINLPMWANASNGTNYSFKHLAAALRIAVNNIPAGYSTLVVEASSPISGQFTADLSVTGTEPQLATTAQLSDENKKVTVTFEAATNEETKNEVFYIPLPAATYTTLKVTVKGDGKEDKVLKQWSDQEIKRGTMYYTTATIDATSVDAVNDALKDAGDVPITINLTAQITTTEDSDIEIPEDAKDVTLNFTQAPTTTTDAPLVINQNESAQSGEASSELNITMPEAATGLHATIVAPTTTVTLTNGVYESLEATTATNTLIIGDSVTVKSLTVKGGNVVLKGKVENIIAEAATTITLENDITLSNKLNFTHDTKIIGNEHTLTYTGSDRAIDMGSEANGANLTIENLNVNCTANYCPRGINYNTTGNLILKGVTVKGVNITYAVNFPSSANGATVTIEDCNLTANIALNVWGKNMNITVNNSHLTSVDNATHENYEAVKLNNDGASAAEGTTITINGGSITATDENGNPSYTHANATETGRILISVSTELNGKEFFPLVAVTYPDTDNSYLCSTIEDAIKVMKNGSSLILLKDSIVLENTITFPADKTVTLDLNGKKITANTDTEYAFNISGNATITNGTIVTDSKYAFVVDNAERLSGVKFTDLTITATRSDNNGPNGTVILVGNADVTLGADVEITANGYSCVVEGSTYEVAGTNCANVTIDGASLTLTSVSDQGTVIGAGYGSTITVISGTIDGSASAYAACAYPTGGTVNITGGTIKGALHEYTTSGVKTDVIVTGGTFTDASVSDYLADGYKATANENIWTVTAE